MSINDLEDLRDEFRSFDGINDKVFDIYNELDNGLDTALKRKVLKDVVSILKKAVKMVRISEDVDEDMEDLLNETADEIEKYLQCACVSIGACSSGSGRGKGGKGLGARSGRGTSEDCTEAKKEANAALDIFFKKTGVTSTKKAAATKATSARCPRGTRRNKRTGICESTRSGSGAVKDHASSPKAKAKTPRCPRGSRRNKKTGNCDPNK